MTAHSLVLHFSDGPQCGPGSLFSCRDQEVDQIARNCWGGFVALSSLSSDLTSEHPRCSDNPAVTEAGVAAMKCTGKHLDRTANIVSVAKC
jgi:hypothetical protein